MIQFNIVKLKPIINLKSQTNFKNGNKSTENVKKNCKTSIAIKTELISKSKTVWRRVTKASWTAKKREDNVG